MMRVKVIAALVIGLSMILTTAVEAFTRITYMGPENNVIKRVLGGTRETGFKTRSSGKKITFDKW